MGEFVTVRVPAQFAEMVEIDQFLETINEHAILTVTDPAGRIIYANDAFCRLSQWDRSELIGQHYGVYSSGYHPDSFYEELWSTINAGLVWRGRVKNRAKDGSFYWIDAIVKPVLDQDGKITHIISIRSDITELVETQEALERTRQNEAAIRRILAISSSNIPVERMLGGALEVLSLVPWLAPIKRSAVFLAEPESEDMVLAAYRDLTMASTLLSGSECFGACICDRAADGRTVMIERCTAEAHDAEGDAAIRWEHLAIPLISRDGISGVLVLTAPMGKHQLVDRNSFLVDVAKALTVGIEQKHIQQGLEVEREEVLRKQQQLEENNALMEAGFENMAEGLVALTPDLTVLAANRRFAELMEFSPEMIRQGKSFEPVLQHMRNQVVEHSRGATMSPAGIRKVIRGGTGKPVQFKFRSGKTLEARANPIPEVGAVFTLSDITDAIVTEGRARQSHKLEALGELAGGVAHEYNNLLTSIQGFARMALKKFGDEDRVREALDEIIEASGRATEITQQMLTFSTKRVLSPVVVDVGETIRSMEPMLRVFLQSKLEIRFEIKAKAYADIDPSPSPATPSRSARRSPRAMATSWRRAVTSASPSATPAAASTPTC
jgi:PAS domain S-box-containing protein